MQTSLSPGDRITIEKRNFRGDFVVSYPGWLVQATDPVLILARWDQASVSTPYVVFAQGDLLLEAYFRQRPYNIFALYDGKTLSADIDWPQYLSQAGDHAYQQVCRLLPEHALKGYYINFTRPMHFDPQRRLLTWYDMVLDVWIPASGKPILLDEEPFERLQLAKTEPELATAIAKARDAFLQLPSAGSSSLSLPCTHR